jgi:Spy/CpxP family protein refolding chaperone
MKMTSKILTLALVGLMFMSVNTFAQMKDGGKRGQGIENNIPNLTDQQKTDIEKLRTEHKKQVLPITNDLGLKRAELQNLRTAEKPDQNAIDAKVAEIGALQTKLMTSREKQTQDIRALLTDEQKVYFDTNRKKHNKNATGCAGKKGSGADCVKKCN